MAEVLLIRQLLAAFERDRRSHQQMGKGPQRRAPARALLVLPYVSIVSEKAAHLERVLAPLRARVKGYGGGDVIGSALVAQVWAAWDLQPVLTDAVLTAAQRACLLY